MSDNAGKVRERRYGSFADGFVLGFAAPSMLVTGMFSETGAVRSPRRGQLEQTWNDVGQFIRESADDHIARTRRDSDKSGS